MRLNIEDVYVELMQVQEQVPSHFRFSKTFHGLPVLKDAIVPKGTFYIRSLGIIRDMDLLVVNINPKDWF